MENQTQRQTPKSSACHFENYFLKPFHFQQPPALFHSHARPLPFTLPDPNAYTSRHKKTVILRARKKYNARYTPYSETPAAEEHGPLNEQ